MYGIVSKHSNRIQSQPYQTFAKANTYPSELTQFFKFRLSWNFFYYLVIILEQLISQQLPSGIGVRFRVFNATFSNISDISWRSVLLVEKTGGP